VVFGRLSRSYFSPAMQRKAHALFLKKEGNKERKEIKGKFVAIGKYFLPRDS
jgi:hypothetical protein